MEAVAEPEAKHEVVTIDENKAGRFKPVPPSNVSHSLKMAAVETLARGVKAEDLAKELIKTGAVEEADRQEEQAKQDQAALAEQDGAELYDRFLLAFLRYATGRIENLGTEEMEDIALLIPKESFSFAEWKRRRNG
jgi:hypothetical protein